MFTPRVIYVQSQSWFPLPFPSMSALIYLVHTMPLESLWHSHHQKWVEMLLSQDDLVSFRVDVTAPSDGITSLAVMWTQKGEMRPAPGSAGVFIPLSLLWLFLGLVYFVCFLHCI